MPKILNTLTKAEILDIRVRSQREERLCAWCEKPHQMLAEQKFCCASCRASYATASARIQYEKLCNARELWLKEREAFVREVEELKERLRGYEGG